MPSYSNGYIPENLLVKFKTGWNSTDGNWYHGLSPATYAKHLKLVRIAKERTGKTLAISDGWGAYRPYAAQVKAREIYGNGAATPGTSSHGGYWESKQTLAMDYSNWGDVYNWNQDAFFADARSAGLTPGMIMKNRGYPDEPWHVIDLDPWGAVPAGETGTDFEMPLDANADYPAFRDMLFRALKWDVRPNGAGPDWKLGPTLWEAIARADDSSDIAKLQTSVDGVNSEIVKVNAAVSGIVAPDIQIDVDKLVAELRAGLAPEIVKALAAKLSQ